MPIYEYECIKCGKIKEAVQKISDNPLTVCPHCSGKLQKLISQTSFHLKGTGWYVTDYANGSRKPSDPPKAKETDVKTETKKPKKNVDKAS